MVKARKGPQKPKYEYQILVNKKVVWHGVDARRKIAELSKKRPKLEIGIRWVSKGGVLIAKTNLSL